MTTGETAVKANNTEAQRLYQRGVAAARSGQKRVAAGLLTRSVQLDPRGELAWLWLSGVLDDPQQQAFCLAAVLKLNPQNQHAQRGLQLLQQRQLLRNGPQPAPGLEMPADEVAATREERGRPEGWWVGWRRNRHEMSRARLILWALPIVLVAVALLLYQSVAVAFERATQPPVAAAPVDVAVAPMPTPPAFAPQLEAEPLAVIESLTIGYLSALGPLRADLRSATASYRQVTSQPGGLTVGHVAATQRLREQVQAALDELDSLRPPRTLQQAHDDYRQGLTLEVQGLDAILEFYSGYAVANTNRAAQRFQEARAYIDRASAAFAAQAQQLADLSVVSAHTAR